MYARGMSAREIIGHLRELFGIEVSPDLVGAVTDASLEEIAASRARPLEPVYPLVFFDASPPRYLLIRLMEFNPAGASKRRVQAPIAAAPGTAIDRMSSLAPDQSICTPRQNRMKAESRTAMSVPPSPIRRSTRSA